MSLFTFEIWGRPRVDLVFIYIHLILEYNSLEMMEVYYERKT
jgi:hypothetical protein